MRTIFGARAQVGIGTLCLVVGFAAWGYGSTLHGEPLLRLIFHISMFFGVVACYAVVATGLGFLATERVEAIVDPTQDA